MWGWEGLSSFQEYMKQPDLDYSRSFYTAEADTNSALISAKVLLENCSIFVKCESSEYCSVKWAQIKLD